MDASFRRAGRDRPRGPRVLVRQRTAAPPPVPGAVPARATVGHRRRVPPFHRGRRVPPAGPVALGRLGRDTGARVDRASLLGAGREWLVRVHAGGDPAPPPGPARQPPPLLPSRGVRPPGPCAAAARSRKRSAGRVLAPLL